jgi:lipoprotein NlpI
MKSQLIAFACTAAVMTATAQTPGTDPLLEQAAAAFRKDDFKGAFELINKAIAADAKHLGARVTLATYHSRLREYEKAAEAYGAAMPLAPNPNRVRIKRAEELFRAGKIKESLVDFDKFNETEPAVAPHNWQRGIALYYAGRFADGVKQFEIHQTVNKNDVENAVWHFLCLARAQSLAEAKHHLIPISGDARVPMAEIHKLFAGKATPEDVLAAAKAAPSQGRSAEPLFYANLYLGIYFEATGDAAKAREYIFKAAGRANENGYMGDVARVHADILKKQEKK